MRRKTQDCSNRRFTTFSELTYPGSVTKPAYWNTTRGFVLLTKQKTMGSSSIRFTTTSRLSHLTTCSVYAPAFTRMGVVWCVCVFVYVCVVRGVREGR